MEAVIFNKTKNKYLYVMDLADDPDYNTDYTVYDICGNDQDGGCFNAETDDPVEEAIAQQGWTGDELLSLPEADAEDFVIKIDNWSQEKLRHAADFVSAFKDKIESWEKL